MIYSNDHNPPHVHAVSPGGCAKIKLITLECYYSRGYSRKDLKLIINFISEKRDLLMEAWHEIQS